jgi:hypothetical protein
MWRMPKFVARDHDEAIFNDPPRMRMTPLLT